MLPTRRNDKAEIGAVRKSIQRTKGAAPAFKSLVLDSLADRKSLF